MQKAASVDFDFILKQQKIYQEASISTIMNHLGKDKQKSLFLAIAYVFGSLEQYEALVKEFMATPKAECSAWTSKDDQTYYCIDCSVADAGYYCDRCFESGLKTGQHKGHRYNIFKNQFNHQMAEVLQINEIGSQGVCDCGSLIVFRPGGNCPHHNGKIDYGKQLNQPLLRRLQEVLDVVFEQFLTQIELMMSIINQPKQKRTPQANILLQQIYLKLDYVSYVISTFTSQFCKNYSSLQYEIALFMTQPIKKQRIHQCSQKDPYKFWRSETVHVCYLSYLQLIWKYHLYYSKSVRDNLNSVITSLFAHKTFKYKFTEVFYKNVEFCFVLLQSDPINIMFVSQMYTLVTQLKSPQFMEIMSSESTLQNVQNTFIKSVSMINEKYFDQVLLMLIKQLSIGVYLIDYSNLFASTKLIFLKNFKLYFDLMKILSSKYGYSFKHHHIKLIVNGMLLQQVLKSLSCVDYQDSQTKQYAIKIINDHLSAKKQEQTHPQRAGHTVIVDWNCFDDLAIGSLLFTLYFKLGKDELRKIIESSSSRNNLKQFIFRIMITQVKAFRMSSSKEVGFPDQLPPSFLYKLMYKDPNILAYDFGISVLQLLALISPDQFTQQLFELKFEEALHLLSEILLEESCFINTVSKLKQKNPLATNALQLELINILNLKNKPKFADLKQSFFKDMFETELEVQEVLERVSNLNLETQTYSIKVEYQNITQSILLRRVADFYSQFFQKENSIKSVLKKDNLFQKQIQLQKPTFCSQLTEQLIKSPKFLVFVEKLSDFLWESAFSVENYALIKTMSAICIRNSGDQNIDKIIQRNLEKVPTTESQKILNKIMSILSLPDLKLSMRFSSAIKPTKPNKMKLRFEKLRKQQQQFMKNNQQLVQQTAQAHSKQSGIKDAGFQCLICHQSSKDSPAAIIFIKRVVVGKAHRSYSSCCHSFHKECIYKLKQPFCPICKQFFSDVYSYPPLNQITFLNPEVPNNIMVSSEIPFVLFRFKLTPKEIFDMVSYKTYFSILYPYSSFKKQSQILKAFYAQMVTCDAQKKEFDDGNLLLMEEVTPLNKTQVYIKILHFIFKIPFYKDSVETKKTLNEMIKTFYTKFIVCSFLCFANGSLTLDNYELEYKINESIIKHQMDQFVKGIIFAYYILYDDKRNKIFDNVTNEDSMTEIVESNYPQFFTIDKELFNSEVKQNLKNELFKGVTYESLRPIPKTIEMPETYMQFHLKYNDLRCDQCEDIVKCHKSTYLMCLMCGYKCCTRHSEKHPNLKQFELLYAHMKDKHYGFCLIIDMTNTKLMIFTNADYFLDDHLYKNKAGVFEQHDIKDWTSFKLNHQKWNKILSNLRKQDLFTYSIRNNLQQFEKLQ